MKCPIVFCRLYMGAPRERYFCPSLSAETVWSACRDVDLEALVTVAARNHTSHEQLVRAQHEAVGRGTSDAHSHGDWDDAESGSGYARGSVTTTRVPRKGPLSMCTEPP